MKGIYQNISSLWPILNILQKRKNEKTKYRGIIAKLAIEVLSYINRLRKTVAIIKIKSVILKRIPEERCTSNVSHFIN